MPASFHKSHELFTLHSVREETSADAVVVVEGFFDCMKVAQAGHLCVALMGRSLSKHSKPCSAGISGEWCRSWTAMRQAGQPRMNVGRLGWWMWVRAVALAEGHQPDQLTAEALANLLESI